MRVSERFPKAFALAVILVVLFEAALVLLARRVPPAIWEFVYPLKAELMEEKTPCLLLGDSTGFAALDPAWFTSFPGTLNLCMPAFNFTGQYHVLRRYLSRHAEAPGFLVLNLHPSTWRSGSTFRHFFFRRFIGWKEIAALAPELEQWEFDTFLQRFWMARRYAEFISREPLRMAGLHALEDYAPKLAGIREHRGAFLGEPGREYLRIDGRPNVPDFKLDPRNESYLGKIEELARERGMRVVYYELPLRTAEYEAWKANGFLELYGKHMGRIRREFPGITFIRYPEPHLPNEYFMDGTHLNADGAKLVSSFLDAELAGMKERSTAADGERAQAGSAG